MFFHAGHAPGAAVASNGTLRAGGLQATLAAPPFLPRLRVILHTDPDQQSLEGSSESALYDVTNPQGDDTPAFSAPHCTSLWLEVVDLHSQAELIAAELSAVSHIQVCLLAMPCLVCCRMFMSGDECYATSAGEEAFVMVLLCDSKTCGCL